MTHDAIHQQIKKRLLRVKAIADVVGVRYVVTRDRSIRTLAGDVATAIAAVMNIENSPSFRRALRQAVALLGGLPPAKTLKSKAVYPGLVARQPDRQDTEAHGKAS